MPAQDHSLRDSPRAAVRRALSHLRELIEDADLRQRDVEEKLGWSPGYLSQVLSGRVELRLCHLELLLEALGVPPARFFGHVLPARAAPSLPPRPGAEFQVTRDVILIYGYGIEAIRRLHHRLERCEDALREVSLRVGRKISDSA